MVYLVSSNQSNHMYSDWLCGGAIVSSRHILTSAACIFDTTHLYAIAGYNKFVNMWHLDDDVCTNTRKKRVVNTYTFKTYDLQNGLKSWTTIDIGIALVDTPYNFSDVTYKLYCSYVPDKIDISFDPLMEQEHVDALTFGWGHKMRYRGPTDVMDFNSQYLRYARTKIMNSDFCSKKFNTEVGPLIKTYMICCQGEGNIDIDGEPIDLSVTTDTWRDVVPIRLPNPRIQLTEEDEDRDWRRKEIKRRVQNSLHTYNGTSTVELPSIKRRQGMCQNDQGGPLVAWSRGKEVVIGIASSCLVDTKDLRCQAPFLYTSTYRSRFFLQCVLSDSYETRRRCIEAALTNGISIEDREIIWEETTQGYPITYNTVNVQVIEHKTDDKNDVHQQTETPDINLGSVETPTFENIAAPPEDKINKTYTVDEPNTTGRIATEPAANNFDSDTDQILAELFPKESNTTISSIDGKNGATPEIVIPKYYKVVSPKYNEEEDPNFDKEVFEELRPGEFVDIKIDGDGADNDPEPDTVFV